MNAMSYLDLQLFAKYPFEGLQTKEVNIKTLIALVGSASTATYFGKVSRLSLFGKSQDCKRHMRTIWSDFAGR